MTSPAADAGLSIWWPTPVRPTDHFSAEELSRSAELHAPVRRIRRELAIGRAVVLAGAGIALGSDVVGDRLTGAGLLTRSVIGAVAVVVAVRLPEAVATRRLARLDGVESVGPGPVGSASPGAGSEIGGVASPGARWVGAAIGPLVALVVLAAAARFLLGPLTGPTTGWVLAIAGAAAVTVATMVATAVRAARADEVVGPHPWGELLQRAGLGPEVGLGVLGQPGDGGVAGPNACAIGIAGRRWILVDRSLLATDAVDRADAASAVDAVDRPEDAERVGTGSTEVPEPIGAFIVAHEATHLARRHPEVQVVIHAIVLGATLGAIPLAAAVDGPWRLVGLPPDDPITLPIAVLVALVAAAVLRLPAAWVLRGLERSADAGAVGLVGIPDRGAVRTLHLQAGGELAPPWWSQLTAVRPSPAERLEYLARCRRSATNRDRRSPPDRAPRPTPPRPSGR